MPDNYDSLVMSAVTPPPTDPVQGAIEQQRSDQATNVGVSMYEAKDIVPDQQARVRALSTKIGLPQDIVARNYDAFSKTAELQDNDYDKMVMNTPGLSSFIADKNNAGIMKDDLPGLSETEDTLRAQTVAATAWNALKSGITQAELQVGLVPAFASDALALYLNTQKKMLNQVAKAFGNPYDDQPFMTTPKGLRDNRVVDFLRFQAEQESGLSPEANQSITEEIGKGNYAKAGRTAFYQVVNNAPSLAVMMGLGVLGFEAAGLGFAGATQGAETADENAKLLATQDELRTIPQTLRDPDQPLTMLTPESATLGALGKGAAEMVFEHVGTMLPLKHWEDAVFKAGGKAAVKETVFDFSKTMVRTIFSNSAEEATTQLAQDLTDYYTGANPDALKGVDRRMLDAGFVGGIIGGSMVAPTAALAGRQRVVQARQTQSTVDMLSNLVDQAKASKTRARSPELHTEFIESLVAGSKLKDVQIAPEALEVYFQKQGLNPVKALNDLDILPEFGRAKETGLNVTVPLAKFVDSVAKHGAAELIQDVKANEEALSANELKELQNQTADDVRKTEEQAVEDAGPLNERGLTREQEHDEQVEAIRKHYEDQLVAAGQDKTQAKLVSERMRAAAERAGISPKEVFDLANLHIYGPDNAPQLPEQSQVLNQSASEAYRKFNTLSDEEVGNLPMEHLQPDTAESLKLPFEEAEYNHRLQGLDDITYAMRDGRPIGHLAVDDGGSVKSIYVDPEYRGEGVAERLYEQAFKDNGYLESDDINAMEISAKKNWSKLSKKYPNEIKKTKDGWVYQRADSKAYDQSDAYLRPVVDTFYSKMIRTVEEKMPATAPADQVKGILKDIKAEERKWLGLDTFLKDKTKVSKDELLEFLRANNPEIVDVTKGTRVELPEGHSVIEVPDGKPGQRWIVQDAQGQTAGLGNTRDEALNDFARVSANPTKYSSYTLPGGTDYREVLLTLPADNTAADAKFKADKAELRKDYLELDAKLAEAQDKAGSAHMDNPTEEAIAQGFISQEDADRYRALGQKLDTLKPERAIPYKSSHWNEANVLAFTRLNDRVDAEGKRVLHVEEVQSDWHQEGRKKGYRGDVSINPEIAARVEANQRRLDELRPDYVNDKLGKKERAAFVALLHETEDLERSLREQQRVPDAPFRKTWHEFALKKIIRMAAEGGYDKITWTTGEQQAERYNLAKQIDSISYKESKDGGTTVSIYDKNGHETEERRNLTPTELEQFFGKDVAKRIAEGVGDEGSGADKGRKVLRGVNLSVGGEGMKGFYDKIIPDYLRKFGKKYDATVGETSLKGQSNEGEYSAYPLPNKDGVFEVYRFNDAGSQEVLSTHATEGEAQEAARKANGMTVHSMTLTPKLIEAALYQGFELFQGGEDAPRGRISIEPNRINIELLRAANFSTFAHELGHFNIELQRRLANLPNASQQVKDDFKALMDHVGNTGEDITVEQHEELARSFEGYLMKGKAPSLELRKVFSRMKAWLIETYRSMTALKINFTPEVKGVFDRMMATDEQIERAESVQNRQGLFSDPAKYNLKPEALAELQSAQDAARLAADDEMRARLMRDVIEKQQRGYKAERRSVRDDVQKAVAQEPVYQALNSIRTQTTLDGHAVTDLGFDQLKIDRADLLNNYGRELYERMPRGTTVKEGGVPVDMVASFFGFGSGRAMIEAMTAAEDQKARVERLTEEVMKDRHPEAFDPAKLTDAAMEAIHNTKQADLLRLEMKHLLEQNPTIARKVTETIAKRVPSDKIIKEQVGRILGAKNVEDVTPNVYRVAERKAAAEAAKLLANGDIDNAFEAKRRELINHELYRAAVNQKAEIAKSLKFFKNFNKSDEKLSKTRDINMVFTARAILSAFGIGDPDLSPAKHLESLKKYDESGYQAALHHAESAFENGTGNYQSRTLDDFVAMTEAVKALWDLSKSSKEIEIEGKKLKIEQVHEALVDQINEITPAQQAVMTRNKTKYEKWKSGLLGSAAHLTRMETWSQAFDVSGLGPATRYLFRPVSEAITRYRVELTEKRRTLDSVFKKYERIFTSEKILAPELGAGGHEFAGTQELLMAVLHSGNESNLRKLLVGRGWGSVSEDGTLDRSAYDRFLERMIREGKLTKEHYDFAQEVWDLNDSMKAGAQRAHKQTQGYYFNEITADTVHTPFGEYRGGYIPAKLDLDMSETAVIRAEREAFESNNNSFQFPTTGRGFTKSRVEQFAGPLSLNMNLLSNHMEAVLRFTHIEPVVKQVSRVMTNEAFRKELARVDDTIAKEMIIPWLQRSATQQTVMPSQNALGRATDAMAQYLRKGTSAQVLVGNLTNGLQQLTGMQVALARVGKLPMLSALATYMRHPTKTVQMIEEISPWFKTTQNSTLIEAADQMNDILMDPTVYQDAKKFISKHGQFLQGFFQNIVNTTVWAAAYNEQLIRGTDPQDAVFIADGVVRTTQGTQNAEDISAYETGTHTAKMFKMFTGYFNMLGNLQAGEVQKISRDIGLKRGGGRLFYLYTMSFMGSAVMAELVTQAMSAHLGPDDDETALYYAFRTFFGSQFKTLTAMVPYVGPVAAGLYNKVVEGRTRDKLSLSPIVSLLDTGIDGVTEIRDRLSGKIGSERKMTNDILTLVGVATQLPLKPLAKPINYQRDVNQGVIRPTGPIDYTRGLITGKGDRR